MQLSIGMSLVFIIVLAFVLVKSTTLVISSIYSRGHRLAVFFVALSTSFPEIAVAVSSGLIGYPALSLGNVIGSNIANITLILGMAALSAGSLRAASHYVNNEIFYVFLIGTLPSLLMVDGLLSQIESLGLVIVYILYMVKTLSKKKTNQAQNKSNDHWRRMLITVKKGNLQDNFSLFVVGIAGMMLAASTMVKLAVHVAHQSHVPLFLIGLLVVAVGTSIPELVFEFVAIKHRENQLAFGNILGSVVANSTLILGLTGLLHPITLGADAKPYLISMLGFVMMFGLFWWFVRTKRRLDQWEGGALVLVYVLFTIVQYSFR